MSQMFSIEAQNNDGPESWADLRSAVVDHHGVYRIDMGRLRAIGGYGRLGPNVRQILSSNLAGLGIGHLPAELPSSQDQEVLLYQYGTPAAEVVAALRGDVTASAETALVQLNSSRDLERVREATVKAAELLTVLSDRCSNCLGPLS
ncbi:MAG TPA: hypothetical protein VF444_25375 [Pseudonocardiaceae bacterium]